MKITEILNLVTTIAPYIFGAGGVLAFFQERKKRKIELQEQQSGALQEMQSAYETFVKQSMEVIKRLEGEVKELKYKIDEQKKEFHEYKEQCSGKKCNAI